MRKSAIDLDMTGSADTGNEVRPMHWVAKLLLTVLVGGLFGIGALFVPIDVVTTVIPRALVGPLCAAVLVLSTTLFAGGLFRRERNGWLRSLLMGVVIGMIASTSIVTVAFLVDVLFDWLFSLIRLG